MSNIVIIGAGAAGLAAARALTKHKHNITIVEARDRIGGRIHTVTDQGFSVPVEAGAEFIHGELKHTMSLLKEAHVSYQDGRGRTWNVKNNKVEEGSLFEEGWDEVMDKLESLKQDISIADFLNQYFSDQKYRSLTDSIKRFVQGYDAADIHKVSAKALYEEWSGEDIKGYRPIGGYGQVMIFLLEELQKNNVTIRLSSPVKKISWQNNYAEVITDKEKFTANKIIITVPVNVLKSNAIEFSPDIQTHRKAMNELEVGGVIKFLVEFNTRIWQPDAGDAFRKMPDMNFLFSDAFVPTWWTQNPSPVPLMTGWLAGPVIQNIQQDDHSLLNHALESLAYFFGSSVSEIQKEIRTAKVYNWMTDPFAQGAYAYKTLKATEALKIISKPIEDTIYFAGEAFYDGPEMGTVEAALNSGFTIAEKIS